MNRIFFFLFQIRNIQVHNQNKHQSQNMEMRSLLDKLYNRSCSYLMYLVDTGQHHILRIWMRKFDHYKIHFGTQHILLSHFFFHSSLEDMLCIRLHFAALIHLQIFLWHMLCMWSGLDED